MGLKRWIYQQESHLEWALNALVVSADDFAFLLVMMVNLLFVLTAQKISWYLPAHYIVC